MAVSADILRVHQIIDLQVRQLFGLRDGVQPVARLGNRQAILDALQQTHFNRTAAAKLLGITFRSLRYRMERLGLNE